MLTGKKLYDFAELVLGVGVNLQKGQGLELVCPVEKSEVAVAFSEKAYEMGARIVNVRWSCEKTDRVNYLYAEEEALTDIPKWFVDSKNYLVKKGFCYVAIDAEDPSAFKDVPSEKLAAVSKKKSKLLKAFSDEVMSNGIRWCVVSVPTESWAKKIFPAAADPVEELSSAIEKTMRLDEKNPLEAWQKHIATLNRRAEFMNAENFEYLHYTSANGTDLMLGLAENHVWVSAQEKAKDGVPFVANMPTEEIFTAPHKDKINGVVKSALPLSYNGQIIENFSFTFKKGKVIDFSAEKGYDVLKKLLETDAGTLSLGEAALIGKNSPIAKSGILFLNTLFDENASCHLALGKGYPTTVKGGAEMTVKELKKLGVNDSVEHVDFMIGSHDLSVTGIGYDKSETPLFVDGEWVI